MYVVKDLRKEELLRLLLAGYKLKDCAAQLKVTPFTISCYIKEEGFMEQLKEKNASIWEEIDAEIHSRKASIIQRSEEAAELALEEMIKLATKSNSELTKFKAAQDLMDRHPQISRTKRIEGSGGGSGSNVVNAVFLRNVVNAMKEEDNFIDTTAKEVVN
jgi:predicted transcriptional regulator